MQYFRGQIAFLTRAAADSWSRCRQEPGVGRTADRARAGDGVSSGNDVVLINDADHSFFWGEDKAEIEFFMHR